MIEKLYHDHGCFLIFSSDSLKGLTPASKYIQYTYTVGEYKYFVCT